MRHVGNATEILPAAASRSDWLAARRAGVTASEIASLMGVAPSYAPSPFSLFCDKTGILPDDGDDTPRLALGRHLEPFILEQFVHITGLPLGDCGLIRSNDRPWQLATPDAITLETDPVPVEAKTYSTYDGWGPDWSSAIPPHYEAQLRWQMDTIGAAEGWVIAFFLHTQRIRIYPFTHDEDQAAVMRAAAEQFMGQVRDEIPPLIDAMPATTRALKTAMRPDDGIPPAVITRRLRVQFEAAARRYKSAKARRDEMENALRAAMGHATTAVDARTGEKLATRSIYTVQEHVRKASVVDRIYYRNPRGNDGDGSDS